MIKMVLNLSFSHQSLIYSLSHKHSLINDQPQIPNIFREGFFFLRFHDVWADVVCRVWILWMIKQLNISCKRVREEGVQSASEPQHLPILLKFTKISVARCDQENWQTFHWSPSTAVCRKVVGKIKKERVHRTFSKGNLGMWLKNS